VPRAVLWYNLTAFILGVISATVIVGGLFWLAHFLNPPKYYKDKNLTYECGFKPISWITSGVDVAFFRISLIFLLFDVEILLLFPWALNFFAIKKYAHISVLFILGILIVGLILEIRTGALKFYPQR